MTYEACRGGDNGRDVCATLAPLQMRAQEVSLLPRFDFYHDLLFLSARLNCSANRLHPYTRKRVLGESSASHWWYYLGLTQCG